jgi:hypothetical protein
MSLVREHLSVRVIAKIAIEPLKDATGSHIEAVHRSTSEKQMGTVAPRLSNGEDNLVPRNGLFKLRQGVEKTIALANQNRGSLNPQWCENRNCDYETDDRRRGSLRHKNQPGEISRRPSCQIGNEETTKRDRHREVSAGGERIVWRIATADEQVKTEQNEDEGWKHEPG